MWQVNCHYKKDNIDTKCPLCKIHKTLQNMCWNVKKLNSSLLVKKTTRENGKR